MRYVAMQMLAWGTIGGAIASAVLLAALDSPLEAKLAVLPDTPPIPPMQAARPVQPGTAPADGAPRQSAGGLGEARR